MYRLNHDILMTMNLILPQKQSIDVASPVIEFYEEGDWLRVEAQGKPTRYLPRKEAIEMIRYIGANTVSEKSDLIII